MSKKRTYHTPSSLERKFFDEWKSRYPNSLPAKEYKFHPKRNFRFDFAWPTKKIAVEVQGMGPGHCSLKGMTEDYNKHFHAVQLNWKVMFLTKVHLSPNKIHETMTNLASLLSLPEVTGYIPLRRRR